MKYIIPGQPIALARPRLGRHTVYDSQKHEKLTWGIYLSRIHGDQELLKGPLLLEVTFYFQPAPSTGKNKRMAMHGTQHTIRPDLDNCIKWVMDVSMGIIYEDDSIVCAIQANKIWDYSNPRTEFEFLGR